MRVLHVFEPPTHGVPNFVAFLARHQRATGIDARVVGPAHPDVDADWWEVAAPDRRSPRSLARFAGHARDLASGADVVHAHSFFAGLTTRLRGPDAPVVYTPHAWAFERADRVAAIETRLVDGFERVACVSRAAADRGRSRLSTTTPIDSMGSAICLDSFHPDGPGVDAPAERFAICVGRISEQKGQLTLAELWRERMRRSDLHLVFVGDGHPELGPSDYPARRGNVHFVGPQTNVAEWLRRATLAVQPSRWEAMSLATIEALACGTPVIATDVAGMREAIVEGPDAPAGAVVDTIAGVVDAVQDRLDDPDLLARERGAARPRAVARYSPTSLVERSVEQYRLAGEIDLTATVLQLPTGADLTLEDDLVQERTVPVSKGTAA